MRKPRLISRAVEDAAVQKRQEIRCSLSSSAHNVPRQKTELDRVYELIDCACCNGWRFTDSDGRSWIRREDIQYEGNSIYVVRFRCSVEAMQNTQLFLKVAETVCKELKSEVRFFSKKNEGKITEDISLPYEECAWIITLGELSAS